MNVEHYIQLRKEIAFESVSFGYTTVNLYPTEELEDAQVGYSVSDSGESFTGEKEGDWRKEWFVIGSEDLCGDPIFVELTKPELPVFTAIHGEGDWNPVLIASSFKAFINALEEIEHVAQGRQNPVELERNQVSESATPHVQLFASRLTLYYVARSKPVVTLTLSPP